MNILIAGSRSINNFYLLEEAIKKSKFDITEVTSGAANGVDKMGEAWANRNKVPINVYPAAWEIYGKSAGHIRNEEMAKSGIDGAIILWDGESRGTKDMIKLLSKYKIPFYIEKI